MLSILKQTWYSLKKFLSKSKPNSTDNCKCKHYSTNSKISTFIPKYPGLTLRFYSDFIKSIFNRPITLDTYKINKYIRLLIRVTISALIRFGLIKWFGLDMSILQEFLIVCVPAGVTPGILFMNPSGTGESSGSGRGIEKDINANQESFEERERRRSAQMARDERFNLTWPEQIKLLDVESRKDELLLDKANKENELKRLEVHKNVANRMHKDFSQDEMFDNQKNQATRELCKIEGKIARQDRKMKKIEDRIESILRV